MELIAVRWRRRALKTESYEAQVYQRSYFFFPSDSISLICINCSFTQPCPRHAIPHAIEKYASGDIVFAQSITLVGASKTLKQALTHNEFLLLRWRVEEKKS